MYLYFSVLPIHLNKNCLNRYNYEKKENENWKTATRRARNQKNMPCQWPTDCQGALSVSHLKPD